MPELYTLDTGHCEQSHLPPLVVLHGLMGSADNWRTHLKCWQASRRVIALDLRNHGRSFHVDDMQYTHMAEDVLSTLTSLGMDAFDLLGHSMGGKVAMTAAIIAPDRVRRLIVADIAPVHYPDNSHDDVLAAMQAVKDHPPENRRAADALMAPYIEDVNQRRFLGTNLVRNDAGQMVWRVNLHAIIQHYTDISSAPPKGRYIQPTLFMRGALSSYIDDNGRNAIHSYFPQARLITLKEAGHWLHTERLDAFVETVTRFLAT